MHIISNISLSCAPGYYMKSIHFHYEKTCFLVMEIMKFSYFFDDVATGQNMVVNMSYETTFMDIIHIQRYMTVYITSVCRDVCKHFVHCEP